jgi:hypothetical protein
LCIPEYIEIVEVINNEVLAKLSPLITQQMTEEDLKQFLNLTSKYLGEKEAEVLSEALKRKETFIKNKCYLIINEE